MKNVFGERFIKFSTRVCYDRIKLNSSMKFKIKIERRVMIIIIFHENEVKILPRIKVAFEV